MYACSGLYGFDILLSPHNLFIFHTTASRTGNKKGSIEPSKVVVLPDAAVRGTDPQNMQIKEIAGKGRSSKWLAVHIPDNVTMFKPMKIISSKNAAADLDKIIGPNRETLAKELQTIIGVDSQTLKQMIKKGIHDEKRKSMKKKEEDEEEDEENEDEESDNDAAADGDGDENNDDDDVDNGKDKEEEQDEDENAADNEDNVEEENEDGSADENEDCENEENGQGKKPKQTDSDGLSTEPVAIYEMKVKQCKKKKNKRKDKSTNDFRAPVGKEKNKAMFKNYRGGSGDDDETAEIHQPPGIGMALADYLNGAAAKRKKKRRRLHHKLCQLMKFGEKVFPSCYKHKRRHFHGHHRRWHHRFGLNRLFRKLLKTKTGQFDTNMFGALKQLVMDRIQTSKDGNVHVFPHHGAHKNTYEEALNELLEKDPTSQMYNDVQSPNNQINYQANKPTSPQSQLPGLTLDNTYDGPAIRVPDTHNDDETQKSLSTLLKGDGLNLGTAPELSSLASRFHQPADEPAISDEKLHSQILNQELSKRTIYTSKLV